MTNEISDDDLLMAAKGVTEVSDETTQRALDRLKWLEKFTDEYSSRELIQVRKSMRQTVMSINFKIAGRHYST